MDEKFLVYEHAPSQYKQKRLGVIKRSRTTKIKMIGTTRLINMKKPKIILSPPNFLGYIGNAYKGVTKQVKKGF